MKRRATGFLGVAIALLALGAVAWVVAGGGPGAARAQSVSVLSDAAVELRDIGRLEGTPLIYVEFADGARCVASDNGAGDIDCDW